MVLINFIASVDYKMLHSLVSMQKFLFANTTEVSKIIKSVQLDLTFF